MQRITQIGINKAEFMNSERRKIAIEGTKQTGDVRGVFELIGEATGSRVVRHLLDEEDVGEATFTELPDDAESILVDPNVTTAVHRVVQCVQAGE